MDIEKGGCCEGGPPESQDWAARYIRNRVSSCEACWNALKNFLLDVAAPSHGVCGASLSTARAGERAA
jgi:hypothetical protein